MHPLVRIAAMVGVVVLTGLFLAVALVVAIGNAMLRMVTGGAVKPLTRLERH